jgi:tetratricopeptide (TPR) repeat protein
MANERPDRLPTVEIARVGEEPERDGSQRKLAELLEAQLAVDPPRALTALEAILTRDAISDVVLALARRFSEHRSLAPRAFALLSDAYERLGRKNEEIATLTQELRLARPPRLAEVQRRLAVLRQDMLGDVEGATELLEQQMIRDPGDDECRRRFLANSCQLGRSKEAAQLLSRVVRNARPDCQARVGLDIGLLYATEGDRERARRAFAQVVEWDGDPAVRVSAARELLGQRSGLTPRALIRPLAVLAEHDSDVGARSAAATELLELRGRAPLDARSEIVAWRALLDGPRTEEALERLEAIYEASGQLVELSEVLERRASREPDPAAAQTLALRAAEMCSANATDPERALASWRRYVARHGASRQAHARMIPLFERSKNFVELAKVLADEVDLAPEPQRATALGRLGEVRLRHLSDTEGALELFRRSLELSPRESRSRSCLEDLLSEGEWALRAAEVLEPIYRLELPGSERARGMLRRVLALRADRATAIADRSQASTELGELCESAGQRTDAIAWYERAWSFDPKRTELLRRIDALAESEGQSPQHRLERYVAAVNRVEDPARRGDLLRAIGALEHSRGDVQAAIVTWRRALESEPAHFATHEALVRAYGELGDSAATMEELRRALPHLAGRERQLTLVRIGEVLTQSGAHQEALAICRPLLDESHLDDSVLPALERFAENAEDVDTARLVFERAVSEAKDPEARARSLERLGEFLEGWPGDTAGAARCWRAAADHYLTQPGKASDALRLLERALDHSRGEVAPARHLLELYWQAGEWSRMPEVYALLLRLSEDPIPAIEFLLSLAPSAVLAGAATEFSELVENALWRLSDLTSPWKHPLIAARARVFASAGKHREAAEVYRMLLELYADPRDANDFQTLVELCPQGDFRRDNQRWLFAWRVDAGKDPVPALVDWATAEETQFADREAAIALWQRAALADPSRIPTWEALVRLRLDVGDVEGALDALQPLRALLSEDARLTTELRSATTLIEGLDRVDRALPLLASVLEKAPGRAAARNLAMRILRSASPFRARAGELLERASSASDSTEEQQAMLELLLEGTSGADARQVAQLSQSRKRWFERLFGLTRGEPSFAVAERAAVEFSDDDAIWQRLELLSCQLEDPERALHAYMRALGRPISGEVAEMLGRRLVAFAEDRAQNPQLVTAALERVLDMAPGARWAVDRVKLVLAAERRWPALFALYDRAAGAATDPKERADLLDEAAIAARDVAGDLDRAIHYWELLFGLRREDARVDLALERLYEKRGHRAKLIAHLQRRAPSQSGVGAKALRARIAALCLDSGEGGAALEIVESLLREDPGNVTAHELLERVFFLEAQEGANLEAVKRAGELLEQRYIQAGRHADLARVLEHDLVLIREPAERLARLDQLFELRHAQLGDHRGALECLGELVLLEPAAVARRQRLAELASELGAEARLVELLVAAADRAAAPLSADLLRSAAAIRIDRLGDAEGAVDLHLRMLSGPFDRAVQGGAASALSALLHKIARPELRCDVLERLASSGAELSPHRDIVLEAARVALEELGDGERAVRNLRPLVDALPNDPIVRDRFVQALRSANHHADLAHVLAERATVSEGNDARHDLVELAHVCAERLSDPGRAIDSWHEVRRRFGRDTESFEALARLFEGIGQWQELASLLREETGVPNPDCRLFARLGDVHRDHTGDGRAAALAYVAAGDPEKALRTLESDEKVLFKDPSLCVMVAGVLVDAGRLADAEALLRRHLEHEGRRRAKNLGQVHRELARVLLAEGREKEALDRLSIAAELYPTDPAILAALARASFDRGDLECAEKTYRALLLLLRHSSESTVTGSSRAEVYVELNELALRRGELDRARDHLASALEVALESEEEHRGLEQALRRRAKFDVLESVLVANVERATHPVAAARALASLVGFHRERDTLDETRVAQLVERADPIRRELRSAPSDASELEVFEKMVEVYVSLDQPEQAVELLDMIAASDPVRFGFEAARLLVDVPFRRDEAATRLQAIWKGNMARSDVALLLSRVLEEEGRLEEALAVHRALPPEHGRERETIEAIVRLEQALGTQPKQLAEALEDLLDLEQGARRADVARRLGALYRKEGDSAAWERVIELGFEADPSQPDLRDQLIDSYTARGSFDRAAAALERAMTASPDPALRWRLAELHEKAGDPEAALRVLDFTPSSRQEKAELAHRKFLLLRAAGRTEEALAELEAAYHVDARHGTELLAAIEGTTLAASSERWALLVADLSVRYGDPAKARRTLAGWLEANPTSGPALRRLAKIASNDGAVGHGKASPPPRHPPTQKLLEQAKLHLGNDDLVDAFDTLCRAHRADKSDGQVSFLLGLVALDLDRLDVASDALRAFVAMRTHVRDAATADEPSTVSRAYFHLAVIEHERGDDGAARRMASRAVEESSNNRDARRLMRELGAAPMG